ncbi:hypothetical protein D1007_33685 [Hordeum vulgare]|nr:hypothetical protein D1007_33685 [Hordeum vulgare]
MPGALLGNLFRVANAPTASGPTPSPSMGSQGAWDGSNVDEDFIDHLRLHRNLLPAGVVDVRLLGAECIPVPKGNEVVVFAEHFTLRFGLPVSTFFRRFLTKFGLQPHRLTVNSILQFTVFITVCEGFLRIKLWLDLL